MESESLLLQTFPLVLRTWVPWIPSVVKTRGKKTFSTLDISEFFVIRSPAPFSSGPTFSLVFLKLLIYLWKPFLLTFVSCQIQHQMKFGFLTTFLCGKILFLYSFQVTGPFFHLSYTFFLCLNLVKNFLFVYASLLPLLFLFLLISMYHSWAWRTYTLKINTLPWISFLPRTVFHCILQSWSVTRPESALLKPRVMCDSVLSFHVRE